MASEIVCRELLSRGLLNEKQFNEITDIIDEKSFTGMLLDKELISFDALSSVLKQAFSIDSIILGEDVISRELAKCLTHSLASKHLMVPLHKTDGIVYLAMANPFDYMALEDAECILDSVVKAVFAFPGDIKYQINKLYGTENVGDIENQFRKQESLKPDVVRSTNDFADSPANRLVKSLINTAVLQKASDIHIEPYDNLLRVRFRTDGSLKEYKNLEPQLLQPILAIIKIMGGMETYIGMTPQVGHAKYETDGVKIDLRFSTVPTVHGEKIAIRLLYGVQGLFPKERLGFSDMDLKKLNLLFKAGHGAILVTGPTGSGKTTTLYSFLSELNTEEVNTVTIEDPVENVIYGANQININPKADLGFANILRSVLRQDPDIIMVGEIRDSETAELAVRAALTGHVVLATLHTNDAISSILRLIDMGVDRFTVAHSVRGVISQRLVRRICPYCKTTCTISSADAEALKIPMDMNVYVGLGCVKCDNTGYSGRFAVYEYFIVDSKVRSLIEEKSSFETISEYLANSSMESLYSNVLKNVELGNTTISEMYRVVY